MAGEFSTEHGSNFLRFSGASGAFVEISAGSDVTRLMPHGISVNGLPLSGGSGQTGPSGATGPSGGPQGATGVPGPTGLTGSQGVTGTGGGGVYSVVGISGQAGYTGTHTSGTIVYVCNTGATGLCIYLPSAVGNTAMLVAKKVSPLNTVVLEGLDAQTVDGYSSATVTALNESKTLVSDGTNWLVI